MNGWEFVGLTALLSAALLVLAVRTGMGLAEHRYHPVRYHQVRRDWFRSFRLVINFVAEKSRRKVVMLLRAAQASSVGSVHILKKSSSLDWDDDPTVLEMWCGAIVYVKDDGSTVPSGSDFAERQPPANCKPCIEARSAP